MSAGTSERVTAIVPGHARFPSRRQHGVVAVRIGVWRDGRSRSDSGSYADDARMTPSRRAPVKLLPSARQAPAFCRDGPGLSPFERRVADGQSTRPGRREEPHQSSRT